MVRGPAIVAVAIIALMAPLGVAADALIELPQPEPQDLLHQRVALLEPAGTPRAMAAPQQMQFVCPDPMGTQTGFNVQDTGNRVFVVYGCPYRVYDENNPFGNPSLAVHPDDVSQMAFASLHGNPDPDGPSDVARKDETHTVFMTGDQGSTWYDEYTDTGFPNSAAVGEGSDIVMDDDGNIYTMLKWSRPQAGGWQGFLGLYKGGTALEERSVKDSFLYGKYIVPNTDENDARYNPGGSVTGGGIVYVADTGLPPPPEYSNQTEDLYGEDGDAAVDYVPGDERVVAMWHELTALDTTNADGWTGWIDAAWTNTSTGNKWEQLDADQRIGPCKDASQPVHYRGDVYIVCTVAKGYDERSRARVGQHDVWRLDMKTGTTELMGYTRLAGGEPRLSSTEDGYMALTTLTTKTVGEAHRVVPVFGAATGWYGKGWSSIVTDAGIQLNQAAGSHEILDAHITAMQVTEDNRMVVIVYKEWITEEQVEAPDFDPDDPLAVTPHLTDYRKVMLAFDECGNFPIAGAEFDLGGGMDAYNYEAYLDNPATYNDDQDGLQVVRDRQTDQELLYFAINDYGAVQYGAVVLGATPSTCIVPQPILPPPPAAIPQALTLTSPTNILTGSIVALPLAGMVGYLLTVKRRTAQFVAAGDE